MGGRRSEEVIKVNLFKAFLNLKLQLKIIFKKNSDKAIKPPLRTISALLKKTKTFAQETVLTLFL